MFLLRKPPKIPKCKPLLSRFNITVFRKTENCSHLSFGAGTTKWTEWLEIKASGRCVELEDDRVLYECLLKNDTIVWIDKTDLRFPTTCTKVNHGQT